MRAALVNKIISCAGAMQLTESMLSNPDSQLDGTSELVVQLLAFSLPACFDPHTALGAQNSPAKWPSTATGIRDPVLAALFSQRGDV